MRRYTVEVHCELGGFSVYEIAAESPLDAMQIAFALDGGQSAYGHGDMTHLPELAAMWCRVKAEGSL